MDIVESCKAAILEHLEAIDKQRDDEFRDDAQSQMAATQTQNLAEAFNADKDRNINKILNQQVYLKRIMDEDNQIKMLKSNLVKISLEIDSLRRQCTKMNADANKARQEMAETQSKDIEKYQMGQLRSITEDYQRHQDILESRKRQVQELKREIERERRDRDAYLIDVEKKLEKQIQERQKSMRGGGLPFSLGPDGLEPSDGGAPRPNAPDTIELTSVDEYAPYGTAPHSRMPKGRANKSADGSGGTRGGGGGRGRGRRKRG